MISPKYLILLSAVFLNACGLSEFGEDSSSEDLNSEHMEPMTVVLYWSAPTERENGDPLSNEELGGYELRYRHTSGNEPYKSIIVSTDEEQYTIDLPDSKNYTFEVAAFDTDGIYSEFSPALEQ